MQYCLLHRDHTKALLGTVRCRGTLSQCRAALLYARKCEQESGAHTRKSALGLWGIWLAGKLIGWYDIVPVPHIRDHRTKARTHKYGADTEE